MELYPELWEIVLKKCIFGNMRCLLFGKFTSINSTKYKLCCICKEWNNILKTNKLIQTLTNNYFFPLKYDTLNICSYLKSTYHDCNGKNNLDWGYYKNIYGTNIIINDYEIDWYNIRWFSCLHELQHPCIAQIKAMSIEKIKDKYKLLVCFEQVDSSLEGLIYGNHIKTNESQKKPLDKKLIKSLIYQLLHALKYCHSKKIPHGNIAPLRILIKKVSKGYLLKLANFTYSPARAGLKTKIEPTITSYHAPELINSINDIYYNDSRNDIWAAGQMFAQMYYGRNTSEIKNINFGNFDNKVAVSLFMEMTTQNIDTRITAEDALMHPYFANIENECPVIKKYLVKKYKIIKEPQSWYDNIFIKSHTTDINQKMWAILTDWLLEVNIKFKFSDATFHCTLNYIQRYMSHISVYRPKLQLVGTTAIYLAHLYCEDYFCDIKNFIYICDKAYKMDQLIDTQMRMLPILDFRLQVTIPYDILEPILEKSTYTEYLKKWYRVLINISMINYQNYQMGNETIVYGVLDIIDTINRLVTCDTQQFSIKKYNKCFLMNLYKIMMDYKINKYKLLRKNNKNEFIEMPMEKLLKEINILKNKHWKKDIKKYFIFYNNKNYLCSLFSLTTQIIINLYIH